MLNLVLCSHNINERQYFDLCDGYWLPFLGVKWLGHGIDHPPPSSAKVKEREELYLYFILRGFMACSVLNFTFALTLRILYTDFNFKSAVSDDT